MLGAGHGHAASKATPGASGEHREEEVVGVLDLASQEGLLKDEVVLLETGWEVSRQEDLPRRLQLGASGGGS